MDWTVGRVAKRAGVSVRTLHHYDEIGLLRPSGRSAGNYRLYTAEDLGRLEQILVFRELGFDLAELQRMLDDPQLDRRAALLLQRRLLVERAARTEVLLKAVERALAAGTKGGDMSKESILGALGESGQEPGHAREAEQRWGTSDAYRESQRRTKQYGKADWARMKSEMAAIEQEMALLASLGHAPEDAEAMDVAEKHRRHIDRWFYTCDHDFHVNLGETYVADERFTAHYEAVRPGLAQFLRDAIVANARRARLGDQVSASTTTKQVQSVRRR